MSRVLLVANAVCLAFLSGCDSESPKPAATSASSAPPRAAVELTLLVVDDTELAAAANLLRGEWAERSGGNLSVREATSQQFLDSQEPQADILIYPSSLLADLVANNWLRPVRKSVLRDAKFAYDDLLPAIRSQVMLFGAENFAISLGEAPMMLALYNLQPGDVGENPTESRTWESLDSRFSSSTAKNDLASEFVARALACTDPRQRCELLFDPETMAPRLTSVPMQQALAQILSADESKSEATTILVGCPTSSYLARTEGAVFSPLPLATETFDSLRDKWEPRTTSAKLTVLGFSGRLASVTTSTRNATSAFKLLGWLGCSSTGTEISSRSRHTTWFRNSQSRHSSKWLAQPDNDQLSALVTELLSSDDCFLLPRIPQIDQYLRILSHEIDQARKEDSDADSVLQVVSLKWEQLTDQLGRDRQRQSYRYHLGLDSWSK